MKKRKENFHIKICPEFLFNGKLFRSQYAVWVYIYLKLDNNYYLQHCPGKEIKINAKQLAYRIGIDESSVFRAIDELIDWGCLKRVKKGGYKLFDEENVMRENEIELSKTFIQIYNNFFMNYFHNYDCVKALKIYYYLYYINKQGKSVNEYEDITFSRNKIAHELKMGKDSVKDAVDFLWNIGLLNKDNDGYYSLRGQNFNNEIRVTPKRNENFPEKKQESDSADIESLTDVRKTKNWVGYYVSKDGKRLCDLIYMDQFKDTGNVQTNWRPYTGKPLTKDEYMQQEDVRLIGRPNCNSYNYV